MSRIRYLVSYDICNPKRLRKVARALEGFGVRHFSQSFRIADVVAHKVANAAHRVTNP